MHTIRSHDALFRFVFGDSEQMGDLLRSMLPADVAADADWPTLQRLDTTFVDVDLSTRRADLLFVVQLRGKPLLLHVIIEHKSGADRWTALQLLRYRVRVWDQWQKDHPGELWLPPILTLVVHHGLTPWSGPRSVRDLVDVSGLAAGGGEFLRAQQPDAPFLLWDLATMTEEDLTERRLSVVADLTLRFLQFLRHGSGADAAEAIYRWQGALHVLLGHPRGQDVLAALLSWYLAGVPPGDRSLHTVMVRIQDAKTRQSMKSMLDYLLERGFIRGLKRGKRKGLELGIEAGRAEGLETGRQEGRLEGRVQTLLQILQVRFGEVSAEIETRLRDGDEFQLEQWTSRAVTAPSVAAVFEFG